jgi:glycine C-acetyltransferase
MNERLETTLRSDLDTLRKAGTYKATQVLCSPQGPVVTMAGRGQVLVLSSNDYLGLAAHSAVVDAGIDALRRYGAGTASVRFICGTFEPHIELEATLATLSGTEAALTYVSCWCANEALLPTLTDADTVILSDQLNHASLIDAIRLARTDHKVVYPHRDVDALRDALRRCRTDQRKLIVTDGVFSMEGSLAPLPEIITLARDHDAVVIVDDSHGVGVLGATGRGTVEHFGLLGEVDIITGTLGKALGGAAGGYVASTAAVCDTLRQRSRPHLFSNAIAPTVAASANAAIRILLDEPDRVARLRSNATWFRQALRDAGFAPLEGDSAIVPIIIGKTAAAITTSTRLLDEGVFVTGFGYPVVPEGTARIRVQLSAAHERSHLETAIAAFVRVGTTTGLVG